MSAEQIKFSIVVSGAPYGSQSASSAYQFCAAAALVGHKINVGVFFDG